MIFALGQELSIWVCLVGDIAIGVLVYWILVRFTQQGVIHVTEGHGGKPDRYLFEFNVDPDVIRGRRYIIFAIKKERQPQEMEYFEDS